MRVQARVCGDRCGSALAGEGWELLFDCDEGGLGMVREQVGARMGEGWELLLDCGRASGRDAWGRLGGVVGLQGC